MQLFTNNAVSVLAADITAAATSLTLKAGDGAKFPNPAAGDDFLLTLFRRIGTTEVDHEIVLCTARVNDVLTVTRAFEGTTARPWNAGEFAELRLTAGAVLPVRGGALTGALNEAPTITLASASAMPVGSAKANTISVTGTTTITAFDAAPIGAVRRLNFAGALSLTHNAASMKLLGNANITTAAGDYAEYVSMGAGNWSMFNYSRANGQPLGRVAVAQGGTGAGTLSGLVHGNGTAAMTAATAAQIFTAMGFTPAQMIEYAEIGLFPVAGLANKLYIATDTDQAYRWNGTAYEEINPQPKSTDDLPEGANAARRYFSEALARGTALTGISTATATAIVSGDSILTGLGKAQGQLNGRALKGANSDITSLSGLTTALSVAQGGTGAKTAADALAALGGVTSADVTARLADVGIGNTNAAPLCADINDATLGAGMYYTTSATIGTFPTAPAGCFLLHKPYGSAGFQMLQPYGSDKMFYRRRTGSTWQAWKELMNADSVATIAQGGTGATTAAAARTALNLGNVENKSASEINDGMTATQVKTSLGYTPLPMGTGVNQLGNLVKIGWLTGTKLGLTVDATDFGSTWPIAVTGNAATATKLASARTINGVSFDGTANITVADSTKAPLTGGGTSGTWPISITGSAASATNATNATNASNVPWAGVSGRPTTFAGYGFTDFARRDIAANTEDLNWLHTPGMYRLNAGHGGMPPGNGYGQLFVVQGGGDTFAQMYFDYNNGDMSWRTGTTSLSILNSWTQAINTRNVNAWVLGASGYAPGLKAGNVDSISNATWQTLQWNGGQQFVTNYGDVYSGNVAMDRHQFHANDGGPTGCSFHRAWNGGGYAVNLALDKDNVIKIGGWSAAPDLFWFDMSGNFTAKGNITAFSDVRLKYDWQDLPSNFVELWAKVKRGTYKRIDKSPDAPRMAGGSAQGVKEILPEVTGVGALGYLTVDNGAAALVATFELAEKCVQLEQLLAQALERISTLEKQ